MGGTSEKKKKKRKITATNGTILSWYLCCLPIRINLCDCEFIMIAEERGKW